MSDKEKKNQQKHEAAMARFKAMKKQQVTEDEDPENEGIQTAGVLPDQNLKRNLGCG